MRFTAFVFLLLLAMGGIAAELPDIAFSNTTWKMPAKGEVVDDVLHITGNSGYQMARIDIPAVTFGKDVFYTSIEVRSSDYQPGAEPFMRPKIRVGEKDGPKPVVLNFDLEADGAWHQITLSHRLYGKADAEITIEIGIQGCSGTVDFRAPKIGREHPPVESRYPFALPDVIEATLAIDTKTELPLRQMLFGVNQQFAWSPVGYGDQVIQDFITQVRPPSLRFPGGTVANFYDWTTDSYAVPEGFSGPLLQSTRILAAQKRTAAFTAYAELCGKLHLSSPLTFNILGDSIESSVARLRAYREAGLRIEHIEIGNENYFLAQRGGRIPDVQAYLAFGQELATALRAIDPNIPIAVNISGENFEKSAALGQWNAEIAKADWYDAVVLHPYLDFDSARPDTDSLRHILKLRTHLNVAFAATRDLFGAKPILLSEWGILGDDLGAESVCAAVAVADGFLAIIDDAESGTVHSACLHMLCADTGAKRSGTYGLDASRQIRASRRAAAYELVLAAFRDAKLFSARSRATAIAPGLPGVSARAARRPDGSIAVLATNLTDRVVPLTLTIDGVAPANVQRRSYVEDSIAIGTIDYPLGGIPFQEVTGVEALMLPPLSVNLIEYHQSP